MATCPKCGRRAAFGAGRVVLPALVRTEETLVRLRGERVGGRSDLDKWISAGEAISATLHTVLHNMSAMSIEWGAVHGWFAQASVALATRPVGHRPSLTETPPAHPAVHPPPSHVAELVSEPQTPLTETATVIIFSPHDLFRRGLGMVVEEEPDISVVGEVGSTGTCLEQLEELRPTVLLVHREDVDFRPPLPTAFWDAISATSPATSVIVVRGCEAPTVDMHALRAGVRWFESEDLVVETITDIIRSVVRGGRAVPPDLARAVLQDIESQDPASELSRLNDQEIDALNQQANGKPADAALIQIALAKWSSTSTHQNGV